MGLKTCCRVVSSFAAEVRHLCCRVIISLKLSCSCSFEHQVEYDTELSHFTLVIIAISAEEPTFLYALSHLSRLRHNKGLQLLIIGFYGYRYCSLNRCRFLRENYNSKEIYCFEFKTPETS